MTLADPKNIIASYAGRKVPGYYGGPSAVTANNGFQVVGESGVQTAERSFRLGPQTAVQTPINPRVGVPAVQGGERLPALRPSGVPAANMNRGFTMGPSPTTIDVSARPAAPVQQISYTPKPEPIRTMPNARGLRATTVFGQAPAPVGTPATPTPMYKAGTAFAKGVSKVANVGLRSALRGAGGAVLTDMVLPHKLNDVDETALVKNWSDPRNNQAAFRASQKGAYRTPTVAAPAAPVVAKRPSLRRAAAPVLAGNPEDPPQGFGMEPTGPAPMITEQIDAAGVLPASVAAGVEIGGANGGFAFMGDKGGKVERMFSLRQRTAEEDLAQPREVQPAAPATVKDMSPGSQGAWERDQEIARLTGGGMISAKDRAALITAYDQQNETVANNLRTNIVSKQNADSTTLNAQSTAANTVSQIGERDAELPVKLEDGRLKNRFYQPLTESTIRSQNAYANAATTNAAVNQAESASTIEVNLANATKLRKEVELSGNKADIAKAKNDEIKFTNASKAYNTVISQDPNNTAAAMKAYADSIELHDTLAAGGGVDFTPATPKVKGTFGFGGSPAVPAKASFRKAGAAKTAVATATDKQGQKWVKYSDGTTAKM